jgi:hypothetical protein
MYRGLGVFYLFLFFILGGQDISSLLAYGSLYIQLFFEGKLLDFTSGFIVSSDALAFFVE